MSYAVIPLIKIRTKKTWKAASITPGKEYGVWVYKGHGLFFNDAFQPVTISNNQMRRAKRKKDFLYKLVKRS